MRFKPTCFSKTLLCVFLILTWPVQAMKDSASFQKPYRFQFKEAPRHAWHDLKSSFWGVNGLLFVAGLGVSASLHPLDDDVSRKFTSHPLFGKKADDVIGNVFSPYTLAGASFVTFLISNTTSNSKLTLAMESSSEALFISLSLAGAAKYAFGRQRPNGQNYSLPSAHSTAVFSTAAVLTSFYGWRAAVPSYALASVVSMSRLDANVHYLTDVLAGAVLGSAVGWGTAMAHKKDHQDYLILPHINSNEAGLVFYKPF